VVLDSIADEISRHGPIPFERFMALALYSPDGGFFSSDVVRSTHRGDFLTSPEVSPWFGRTLARPVAAVQRTLGGPFTLVEAGAGSGSLLRPLLGALERRPDEVLAVEVSPAARDALHDVADRVLEAIPEDRTVEGVVVANELVDNLPVSIVVSVSGRWEERWVGLDGRRLELVSAPARPDVEVWADRFGGSPADGVIVEVQLAAGRWLEHALRFVERGAVIVFDYGGTTEELQPRRSTGTLRTYRSHHLGPDPLLEPGATDITVDVNFTALADVAAGAGASVEIHRQDEYLGANGLRDRLADLRRRELDLARSGDEWQRLAVRSELRDAETIMHPRGLGDFRVLVATKGGNSL
jgi:SAM-dependent MidA family methyltransferase